MKQTSFWEIDIPSSLFKVILSSDSDIEAYAITFVNREAALALAKFITESPSWATTIVLGKEKESFAKQLKEAGYLEQGRMAKKIGEDENGHYKWEEKQL